MHQGAGYVLGEQGGAAAVSLLASQIPGHAHSLMGDASVATVATPGGAMFARDPAAIPRFGSGSSAARLASGAIATSGAGQAHENMPPYQSLHFIIALEGVFPSQA